MTTKQWAPWPPSATPKGEGESGRESDFVGKEVFEGFPRLRLKQVSTMAAKALACVAPKNEAREGRQGEGFGLPGLNAVSSSRAIAKTFLDIPLSIYVISICGVRNTLCRGRSRKLHVEHTCCVRFA